MFDNSFSLDVVAVVVVVDVLVVVLVDAVAVVVVVLKSLNYDIHDVVESGIRTYGNQYLNLIAIFNDLRQRKIEKHLA